MRKLKLNLSAVSAVVALVVLMAGSPAPAETPAKNTNPRFIKNAGAPPSDSFYNYDGHGKDDKHPTREPHYVKNPNNPNDPGLHDRDWPMTIIWWGNASKARVKAGLKDGIPGQPLTVFDPDVNGRPEYEPYIETSKGRTTVHWNPAKGVKTPCNSSARDTHIRYYGIGQGAPTSGSQRFFDPTAGGYGYFVVSSTHYDRAESDIEFKNGQRNPCYHIAPNGKKLKKWNGRSEEAANFVEDVVRAHQGPKGSTTQPFGPIDRNKRGLFNFEGQKRSDPNAPPAMRMDEDNPNHYWQSDGRATLIYVNLVN